MQVRAEHFSEVSISKNLVDWRGELLALFCGSVLPLALAPFNLWLFAVAAIGFLAMSLKRLSPRRAWLRCMVFGIGMYGTGVSWIYISIHDFGYAPVPLAALMTAMFVVFMALVFSLPFYCYQRFVAGSYLGFLLGFPAAWVVGEWLRSWLFTGFPWLYVGYGFIDTWLAGWAPVLGVYGVSFLVALTATGVLTLQRSLEKFAAGKRWHGILNLHTLFSVTLLWLVGLGLQAVSWTHYSEDDQRTVSIVQPNIPLEVKWNPVYRSAIMQKLRDLTADHWDSDIILWPEAAIPMMYHDAEFFIEELEEYAALNNTALISGILYDDAKPDTYYNAIFGIGAAENIYFKQRLVPFGEYVPLEKYLRGLIRFFDLPNSIIHRGPVSEDQLSTANYAIAPYICYEIVYPDLVAALLREAQLIVTVSNDAWFGDSIGPLQHFQMAQMRALETGRYVIRGTNTGLSGIIDQHGKAVLTGTQFQAETITGTAYLTHGKTPFVRTGSWPILIFSFLLLGFIVWRNLRPHTEETL